MPTNVRLSGANPTPRSESDIRFNYGNLSQIVASSNDLGASTMAIFSSSDGGAAWSQTNLPPFTGDLFQSDPAVDWTSDGTAWALTIGVISNPPFDANVRSFKSTDGGATWTFDSTISGAQSTTDKASLWVDHSPSSPFKDNMYAIWHNGVPSFVVTRSGPTGAWGAPVQVSGAETTFTSDGGDVKTNAFGDVFAFWPNAGGQTLLVAKSTDGGATFGAPVQFGTTSGQFWFPIPAQAKRNVLIYVTAGAYRTASVNLVYACWMDLAGGVGCNTTSDAPGSNAASPCKTQIWFTRSTDGGSTWEAPRKINDQNALNDQFFPRLILDQTDGKLVVVYYDTIGDPNRANTNIWMQTSPDNGVTWSSPAQITTTQSDEATAAANGNQYGDYIGVTGNVGSFFACWTDSRNGIEEIWGAGFAVTVLVTAIANTGDFGKVCVGAFADELLTINNTGLTPLSISAITSSLPDFLVPSVVSYPIVVAPGGSIDVIVRFEPTSPGLKAATITITSNDPAGPHTISVSGEAPTPRLSLVIADSGSFGNVCVGSFADEPLVLNNSGSCTLIVTGITSSSSNFLTPQVLAFPLTIVAGTSTAVPIRFQPASFGAKAGVITITSDDPASPAAVAVSGIAPAPRLALAIAAAGNFGPCCVGSFVDEPLLLSNSGECTLSVTAITSSLAEFLVPEVLAFPLTIEAGNAISVPIRYQPTSLGPASATITVTSNDPASPLRVNVSGDAPPGRLAVAGSTTFGGVNAHCCADRTLSVCNVGDCALRVTSVRFRRKSRHWRLLNNPFPGKLHPGSCLPVVIQYRATERCPRSCDLVIESDDPVTPVKIIEVLAYTIWDSRRKEDCDDCRKGCCDLHREPSCQQGYPCCDDDDDDDYDDRKEG